jgi:PIN domain nuclease of toxin-antitoxin system
MTGHLAADTHAVLWYLEASSNLSAKARDAMRAAINAGARIYVSVITSVELVYLTERGRIPTAAFERLERQLRDRRSPISAVPIDLAVVDALKRIPRDQVPDMPDRIIGATALSLGVPLVSADQYLRTCSVVETIW